MTYLVEFTSGAARAIRKLPRPARARILAAAESLTSNPRPPGATKLVGEATAWRVRIGDYRLIYEIKDEHLLVTLVRAAHRRLR
ncbi:MAG: type II toxin-antitoxin system RelE/ParE family toxin [Bifidobacteriaceae bacterium]|nr:type II toxin-antitoxin system RelE/ParE family toxin [Bifidobacteriaceae bacterium]